MRERLDLMGPIAMGITDRYDGQWRSVINCSIYIYPSFPARRGLKRMEGIGFGAL